MHLIGTPYSAFFQVLQVFFFFELCQYLVDATPLCTSQTFPNKEYRCATNNILGEHYLEPHENYNLACTNLSFSYLEKGAKGWVFNKKNNKCVARGCMPTNKLTFNKNFISGQLMSACFSANAKVILISSSPNIDNEINSLVPTPMPLYPKALAHKFNILYITVDDLPAYLMPPNVLEKADTYNLYAQLRNKLKSFTIFSNAYNQYPVCGPSRASFLSGRRPDNIQEYNFFSDPREKNAQVQTIYGIFKKAGYNTGTIGKIFHDAVPNLYLNELSRPSELLTTGNNECKQNKLYCSMPLSKMIDEQVTQRAFMQLKSFINSNSKQPFLLGLGYRSGHYPHSVPDTLLPLIPQGYLPNLTPQLNHQQFLEQWYSNLSNPDLPFDFNPAMLDSPNYYQSLAYYAAIKLGPTKLQNNANKWVSMSSVAANANAFTDLYKKVKIAEMVRYQKGAAIGGANQIAKVIDFIDNSPFANNTIIVIHHDHGLSQYPANNIMSKNNLFRRTARSPLYIRIPGITGGNINPYPVELVSVRATLCELTGVECNDSASNNMPLDGISFINSIINPQIPASPGYAITQYQRCTIAGIQSNTCMNPLTQNGPDNKPAPFYSNMTYAIRKVIDGTLYELAASFPFVTTYSYYGPVPSSNYAPYMNLYDQGATWRIDYTNTGVIVEKEPQLLFMYEYTVAAGGKNLLFSPSSKQIKIKERLLQDLTEEVRKYAYRVN